MFSMKTILIYIAVPLSEQTLCVFEEWEGPVYAV